MFARFEALVKFCSLMAILRRERVIFAVFHFETQQVKETVREERERHRHK